MEVFKFCGINDCEEEATPDITVEIDYLGDLETYASLYDRAADIAYDKLTEQGYDIHFVLEI